MHRSNNYDRHHSNGNDQSEDVPHSRLFILCGKDITEDQLRDAFCKFGTIVHLKCVEDRSTGGRKGVAYLTFSKTSEAAKALETMNGEFLSSDSKPLKVLVAANREQGSTKKDDTETYVRLFIVVPKTADDKEIREYFKQFGEIDLVHVVKSKTTNESKGVAYVKYFKFSHAARAFEECDRSYKAVFARPRDSNNKKHTDNPYLDRSYGGQGFDPSSVQVGPGDIINNYPNPEGFTKLAVTCCMSLTSDQLYGLFGIVPGLDVIHPMTDARMSYRGGQKVCVQYSSPQAAAYARDKFHGFGFPPNVSMVVVPDFTRGFGAGQRGANPLLSQDSKNTLQTLTNALAQATSLLRSAGLSTDGIDVGLNDNAGGDDSFCSVKLPPVNPLAPSNSEVAKRLFLVCQPGLPPLYSLKDVFARFGSLIDLYILPGKNCGYASYADRIAADQAIETLHGAELYGSRLKVMEAEPPSRDGRKRQRMEMD